MNTYPLSLEALGQQNSRSPFRILKHWNHSRASWSFCAFFSNANHSIQFAVDFTMKWLIFVLLLKGISTESVNGTNNSSDSSPAAALRFPRGTVYQIRPVKFEDGENPFESLSDFKFPKLNDEEIEAPLASDLKVIRVNRDEQDSEALEAVELPKFLQRSSTSDEEVQLRQETRFENKLKGESNNGREARHNNHNDEEPWDASYAFGFTLEDQARHEVSDADGNVRGYYQYVDDEGFVRKVVYTAGAGKGFVVLNKEKVKGPHPPPPKRKPNKVSGRPGGGGYGQDEDSLLRPRPPGSSRPRPNYPESPSSSAESDYGYPAAGPPPNLGGGGWSSGGSRRGSRKPVYVVKIRRPQDKHGRERDVEEEEDNGVYHFDSSENDNGQWDGDVGNGPVYPFRLRGKGSSGGGGGHINGQPGPDGSYTFGYETDTANRLEKSDKLGNVRGSYSYIDNGGVKRTVHYIAGATTGFQVLGTSPSASRSVRIEAPPGFVVTRRNAPSTSSSKQATLATAESEYPSFPPTTVVYHIHPDQNSINLSPWWESFGLSRRPRKMRRVMRVHRKKPRNYNRKQEDEEESENEGIIQLSSPQSPKLTDNLDNSVPSLSPAPIEERHTSSPRPYMGRTRSSSDIPRSFRHSTKVNLDNFDMKTFFTKRRPSHRAYTQNPPHFEFNDSSERFLEERDIQRNDPILLGPSHQALNSRRPTPIPNPIVFQPSKTKVSVRSKGSPLDVAESKLYHVTSDHPVTKRPGQFTETGILNPDISSREVSTSKSMQLTISSSTTRIPYVGIPDPNLNKVNTEEIDSTLAPVVATSQSPLQNRRTPSTTTEVTTITIPSTEESATEGVIMSSSTRLMQRLGVNLNGDN